MLDIFRTRWSPLSLAFSAAIIVLASYYWVWSRSRFVRLIDALPGPKPLWLLGNILDVANIPLDGITRFSISLRSHYKLEYANDFETFCPEIVLSVSRFNPIYKLWIGFYPAVVIAHPELWKVRVTFSSLTCSVHSTISSACTANFIKQQTVGKTTRIQVFFS